MKHTVLISSLAVALVGYGVYSYHVMHVPKPPPETIAVARINGFPMVMFEQVTNVTYTTNRLSMQVTSNNLAEVSEVITKTEVISNRETDESILARNDVQLRIQSDGKRFKVQDNKGFGGCWQDDTWGGYFDSYEKAAERVTNQKAWWASYFRDRETQKNFTNVTK